MSYIDKFDREIILDLDEATELAVKVVMKEGELQFRELLIDVLKKEIADARGTLKVEPNLEWEDGLEYCIHLLKNMDSDAS